MTQQRGACLQSQQLVRQRTGRPSRPTNQTITTTTKTRDKGTGVNCGSRDKKDIWGFRPMKQKMPTFLQGWVAVLKVTVSVSKGRTAVKVIMAMPDQWRGTGPGPWSDNRLPHISC
jgi:hypothetical protein